MKVLKASQLISSLLEDENSEIVITAVNVNKFCNIMRRKNVYCELTLYDFENLKNLYPDFITMDPYEIKIKSTISFQTSIHSLYKFDSEVLDKSDIIKYWNEAND